MAFTVIQAGTSLQLMSNTGVLTTLTLPTGITLRPDIPPRWTTFSNYAVLVNTPSQPLTIDAAGTVRLLCPRPPRLACTLSGVTAGGLSGTYNGVKYTFVTKDSVGNIISESDFSPPSNSVTITNKLLKAANIDVSPDTVTLRRLYRPTTNGAVLFQWLDLDGNVLTSVEDDLSDAGLSLFAAPRLGTPPDLTLIAEFRGTLFGVSRADINNVIHTETGSRYAWPSDNILAIPPAGSDQRGITAFLPRRDALGVARQNKLLQVTGTSSTDFRVIKLSETLGVVSQESVAVYRNIAYFLWKDGVYQWSDSGIECISDGKVRSWFTTDTYFNRSRFQYAFAHVDPIRNKYRLFLSAPASTVPDRWIEFDLTDRTWWGPHKTAEFTPVSAFLFPNSNDVILPVVGGLNSNVYQEQTTRTDGTTSAIDFDVIGKRYDSGAPDHNKYFGELSLVGKAQAAGTLTITGAPGELNAAGFANITYDMTKNRQRLNRLGTGKHVQLELRNNVVAQDVELYGYEINPVNLLGRR